MNLRLKMSGGRALGGISLSAMDVSVDVLTSVSPKPTPPRTCFDDCCVFSFYIIWRSSLTYESCMHIMFSVGDLWPNTICGSLT